MMKASRDTMKSINKQNILNAFIHKDLITMRDIIKKTNLSAATVSSLITDLVKEELILEKEIGESSGGRKPKQYSLNGDLAYVFSLRITPKGAIIGIVNLKCEIVFSKTIIMPVHSHETFKELFQQAVSEINTYRKDLLQRINAVAVSVPGIVDFTEGNLILSATLLIENLNIRRLVNGFFEKEVNVYIFKDTDALILGEHYFSRAMVRNMAYILCENGVGLSLISRGDLFRQEGCGLELGHQTIDYHGIRCKCSMNGCIGTLLSEAPALRRYTQLYEEKYGHTVDTTNLDYDDIINLHFNGDAIANQVMQEQLEILSIAAINVVNLFNPDVIIIGGPLARLGGELEKTVNENVRQKALKPFISKLSICTTKLELSSSLRAMANYVLKAEFFKTFRI